MPIRSKVDLLNDFTALYSAVKARHQQVILDIRAARKSRNDPLKNDLVARRKVLDAMLNRTRLATLGIDKDPDYSNSVYKLLESDYKKM